VYGGNAFAASSVKIYLTYNTAVAADVDLKAGTVRRVEDAAPYQTNLKFPLTLTWAAGEIGEKVISIPTKADKTVEGDKMKSSFLRYITNQMAEPMKSIDNSVTSICNNYQNISKEEMDQLVDNIQRQNQTMTNLLNPMAHFTKSDTGKEADHA
jgi:plasmid maintenance system antidote protein VapI